MAYVLHNFRVVDPATRAEMLKQESAEGLQAISVGLRLKGGGTRESEIQRIQEALEQEARACDPSTSTGRIIHAMGKVGDLGKASQWLSTNYKADDLKALCVELRLSKTGKKIDLAERITAEAWELWKVQASRAAEGSTAAAPVEAAHEAPAVEQAAATDVVEAAAEVAPEEPAPRPTAQSRKRRSRPPEVEKFFRESEDEAEETSDFSDSPPEELQSTGSPVVEPEEPWQRSTPSSTAWEPVWQPRQLQSETAYIESRQEEPLRQPTPSRPSDSAWQDQYGAAVGGRLQPQAAYTEAAYPESHPEEPLPQRRAMPLEQPAWEEAQYRYPPAGADRQLRTPPEEALRAEGSWPRAGTWDVRSGSQFSSQAEERYDVASASSSSSMPGVYDSTEDDDVVKTEPIPDKEEAQLEKRHRRLVERRMKLVGYLAEEVANAYGGYKNNYIADMNKMLAGASDRAREAYLSDNLEEPTPAMLTQRVPEVLGPTCQAPEFGAWHPEPVRHEMQMVGELGPSRLAWCKWWDMNTGCGELVDLDDQSAVAVVSAALTTGANVSPKLKYLTHGEFVEYRRVNQGAGQAARGLLVRGLRGWPLMCEVDGSRALPSGN
eukprot:TRINITY_DN27797_c0_g1_i1.p1 TRINITY_DN27797_c0_g1~~TRINITY_DN27797_c0_g1_i1.p1  ORF type:complete len:708 (+),score=140.29 TRINITY_DN27797_c0_g1_i1:307-2124(+)